MRQGQDPVPLVELLEAADVDTPGQAVDALAERGFGVVVDDLGRLCAPLTVAERLWAEQAERERLAAIEFEKAERVRLAKLEQDVREREAGEAEQARELERRERQKRIEQAVGLPVWQLEIAIRKARASNAFMSYADKAAADERPVSLDEVAKYVAETYGVELAEGGNR